MSEDKKKHFVYLGGGDSSSGDLNKSEGGSAFENLLGQLEKEDPRQRKIPRIALTEDPTKTYNWGGGFKHKNYLIPDIIIKKIRVQNSLIATIQRLRSNTLSMFGRLKHNRFDVGIQTKIKPEFEGHVTPEQMVKIKERIDKFEKILIQCGKTEGVPEDEKLSLSTFTYLQIGDGITLGRFATEIIYEEHNGRKRFNRFRPTDAATIYKAIKNGNSAQAIRDAGLREIENSEKVKFDKSEFKNSEYAYIQAVDGFPKQAFTADEMVVWNLYPTNDIDYDGYPITPIDTTISAITTHLSIDAYNRLYFQNGRAAKGMLIINSEEIDQSTINIIKQEFMASINNVGNAFRVPVLGVGREDSVQWTPMVTSAGDGEFQFLYDNVARAILAAFGVSPDEIPGFGHLSRGTNQKSLSESSNEFKLTSARDGGLRPLIIQFQTFLNDKLFQIIDPELAQICHITLSGLDADSREEETIRLQQEAPLHMTYDQILGDVDKHPVGVRMAGDVPFSERWQIIADKYLNVGDITSNFMHDPTALADPLLKYKRDGFFMQFLNLAMQANPAIVKAYFATKPYSLEVLKMMAEDYLEDEE